MRANMTDPITVTLLFTDIEGWTRLWQEDEASMRRALARHDRLLRSVLTEHGGAVLSTMGDGLAAALVTASAAPTNRAADNPGCR
jgi:class 3 adenylate cyclase